MPWNQQDMPGEIRERERVLHGPRDRRRAPVATLDGTKESTFSYTCPGVTLHAPVYFYQFTAQGQDATWATRFTIATTDGTAEPAPEHGQPDGQLIDWGTATPSPSYLSSSPSSSAGSSSTIAGASSAAACVTSSAVSAASSVAGAASSAVSSVAASITASRTSSSARSSASASASSNASTAASLSSQNSAALGLGAVASVALRSGVALAITYGPVGTPSPNANYILADGPPEVQRLSKQYLWMKHLFNHADAVLPPSVDLSHLPKAKVLDAAAGTAAWALDLAHARAPGLPPLELHASDITLAKFPPEAALQRAGVRAFAHDLTRPFPAEMRGTFDVVHMAYLVYALTADA
ncbi:hypothetical protein OF83DRAFT_1287085 [Amylostereum chailletii]|nr:hypothetical protein OF83DRAFT_1287085 [Amylostereum chailletii]